MIHLIYICSSAGTPSGQDLIDLLNQSRNRNESLNITGMLLYDCGTYMQVLEGDKRDVYQVFSSIKRDSRVERMITLVDEKIQQRDFPYWSMGFRDIGSRTSNELHGFNEIYEGKVDPRIAERKKALAVELVMSFIEDGPGLKPVINV